MVAIVNYGIGNLFSIRSSLRFLGADCVVTSDTAEIEAASHVILPGVGAFGDGVDKLRELGLDATVIHGAKAGKPLLGICLGMQLLYESSCEYGSHRGLGLVSGRVTGIREALDGEALKVPHMGWNSLDVRQPCPLLKYLEADAYVYYVHSFYAGISEETAASSRYGALEMTGLVQRDNVFGAQFHPEKSGRVGLGILKAFTEIT